MSCALTDKVAIVTGASRGIGREVALTLAREGAHLGLAARTGSQVLTGLGTIDSVTAEIRDLGVRAVPVRTDVSQEQDIKILVETVVNELGGVDILVNNAATFLHYHEELVDLPVQSWDRVIDVNLRGAFLCIKAVLPYMVEKRGGSIINISSMAAVRAGKGRIAYGVSKAGLERMSFGLAEEVRGYNIAVNSLAPVGITDTAIARELFPGEDPEKWVRPEDVAKAVKWLACQSAETFTGNAVAVARGATTLFIYGMGTSQRRFISMD
jgi:NAD(P)-dependent dehydrogenase (short-subunit alcohol dehydrogenase family)